mmetsp:Transcript_53454/g.116719  ORF Transcript_53454/g.116719 Transcript_53454/m.116719 type:complete len:83 (-) Transcript_53454:1066-1314(-)
MPRLYDKSSKKIQSRLCHALGYGLPNVQQRAASPDKKSLAPYRSPCWALSAVMWCLTFVRLQAQRRCRLWNWLAMVRSLPTN